MKRSNILISSSASDSIRESVLFAQKLNVGIEISRAPLYKNKQLSVQDTIDILLNDLDGFEGRRTLHAMFSDVNVSSSDWELKEISQKRCMQSFEIGKAIKAETILFHTGNKGTKHYGSISAFKRNFAIFWKDFIKDFEHAGITAVVENVFEETPDYCLDLYNSVNSPNFKLAIDTNLYAQKTQVTDWIKAYGNRLHHMHLHNNYRENDDHNDLTNGTLDFKTIFEELNTENLNPTMVLEMFSETDILKSLAVMETYCKD